MILKETRLLFHHFLTVFDIYAVRQCVEGGFYFSSIKPID